MRIYFIQVASKTNHLIPDGQFEVGQFCRLADTDYGETIRSCLTITSATIFKTRAQALRVIEGKKFVGIVFRVVEFISKDFI